MAVSFSFSLI